MMSEESSPTSELHAGETQHMLLLFFFLDIWTRLCRMLPPKLPNFCGPPGFGRPSNACPTYGHVHEESRKIISAKEGASPGEKCQMSGVVSLG